MILVGVGSNLASPAFRSPRDTAAAALSDLPPLGIFIVRCSRWYLSEPVPPSDQPWYANAVLCVETSFDPPGLLAQLLALEGRFGRRRSIPNAARTLDLDLLDYDGRVCRTLHLILPHPRLHQRRFVLAPLAEIAPAWRHPLLGQSAAELLAALPAGQEICTFDEAGPPRG